MDTVAGKSVESFPRFAWECPRAALRPSAGTGRRGASKTAFPRRAWERVSPPGYALGQSLPPDFLATVATWTLSIGVQPLFQVGDGIDERDHDAGVDAWRGGRVVEVATEVKGSITACESRLSLQGRVHTWPVVGLMTMMFLFSYFGGKLLGTEKGISPITVGGGPPRDWTCRFPRLTARKWPRCGQLADGRAITRRERVIARSRGLSSAESFNVALVVSL